MLECVVTLHVQRLCLLWVSYNHTLQLQWHVRCSKVSAVCLGESMCLPSDVQRGWHACGDIRAGMAAPA